MLFLRWPLSLILNLFMLTVILPFRYQIYSFWCDYYLMFFFCNSNHKYLTDQMQQGYKNSKSLKGGLFSLLCIWMFYWRLIGSVLALGLQTCFWWLRFKEICLFVKVLVSKNGYFRYMRKNNFAKTQLALQSSSCHWFFYLLRKTEKKLEWCNSFYRSHYWF